MQGGEEQRMREELLLTGRDRTDPAQGEDTLQGLIARLHEGVAAAQGCPRQLLRLSPWHIGGFGEHRRGQPRTDLLGGLGELLRTQALDPPADRLLITPGPVVSTRGADAGRRRHQLLMVRLSADSGRHDLAGLVRACVSATGLVGRYRLLPAAGPLDAGMAIEARGPEGWIPVGYCGRATPAQIEAGGLAPDGHAAVVLSLGLEALELALAGDWPADETERVAACS